MVRNKTVVIYRNVIDVALVMKKIQFLSAELLDYNLTLNQIRIKIPTKSTKNLKIHNDNARHHRNRSGKTYLKCKMIDIRNLI